MIIRFLQVWNPCLCQWMGDKKVPDGFLDSPWCERFYDATEVFFPSPKAEN
jgi:hypothetical protein